MRRAPRQRSTEAVAKTSTKQTSTHSQSVKSMRAAAHSAARRPRSDTACALHVHSAAAAEHGLTFAINDERWALVAVKVGNDRSASACRHRWGKEHPDKVPPPEPRKPKKQQQQQQQESKKRKAPSAAGAEPPRKRLAPRPAANTQTKIFVANAAAIGARLSPGGAPSRAAIAAC